MKTLLFSLLLFVVFISNAKCVSMPENDSVYAGFRASRLYHIYPNHQFPPKEYWLKVANGMADKFANAKQAEIWIVGLYLNNGNVSLGFPSPGGDYDKIEFDNEDLNEDYLTYFDENNLKVWLQVEPGSANIDTLMMLVMNRYKHHPSVIGFGIDIEWYKADIVYEGAKVSDAEAEHWDTLLQQVDTSYSLFLKHYGTEWMPPNYRGNIFFVDDSQIFNNLQQMVNEYIDWGETFSPNYSGFQFGYNADRHWWSDYDDPPKVIGQALFDNIPQCKGVFWVDFTVTEIFPLSTKLHPISNNEITLHISPNPINSKSKISFKLKHQGYAKLEILNVLGKQTEFFDLGKLSAGEHRIPLNYQLLKAGIYYAKLIINNRVYTQIFIVN